MDWSRSLSLVAPEELLSIYGLILLLVAAWAGDKASRAITWGTGSRDNVGPVVTNVRLDISAQGPAPVPLPAAGWLLLAGLGGLAALKRKRA